MAWSYILLGVSIAISLNCVLSDVGFYSPSPSELELPMDELESCYHACIPFGNYTVNEISDSDSQSSTTDKKACDRGCRFLGIAENIKGRNVDEEVRVEACKSCCTDSYKNDDVFLCKKGCTMMEDIMTRSRAAEESYVSVTEVTISIVFEPSSSVSETEELGPEAFGIEPSVRQELSGEEIAKLPEVKVKTLPVEKVEMLEEKWSCWTWVNNVIEMRSVPPCLIAAALLLVIIMLIRFVFTCGPRSRNNFFGFRRHHDEDLCDAFAGSSFSQPGKSGPVAVVIDSDNNVLGNVLNKVPPPKYDEAMFHGDVVIKKSPI